MKLLIAFALFAVALADEVQVVDLPKAPSPSSPLEMPDIRQLIIPQHIIDAIKTRMPVMRDFPAEEVSEDLKVRFVEAPLDAPVEADAAQQFDDGVEVQYIYHSNAEIAAPEAVELGDAPLPAYETADLSAPESAPEAVKIAEPILPEAENAPEVSDYRVQFVDAPVAEEIAPEVVKIAEPILAEAENAPEVSDYRVHFVDAPVAEEIAPEPVRIAEAPLPAVETPVAPEPSVEAVKIAVPRFLGKQFADPLLR